MKLFLSSATTHPGFCVAKSVLVAQFAIICHMVVFNNKYDWICDLSSFCWKIYSDIIIVQFWNRNGDVSLEQKFDHLLGYTLCVI